METKIFKYDFFSFIPFDREKKDIFLIQFIIINIELYTNNKNMLNQASIFIEIDENHVHEPGLFQNDRDILRYCLVRLFGVQCKRAVRIVLP